MGTPDAPVQRPGSRRVLVVDDDLFVREPLEVFLREEGFAAECAADGNECLERVSAQPPDLIILDVMMPGRDGYAVCRSLRQDPRSSGIPILMLSARDADTDRDRGISAGADDYFTKPYAPAELIRRVRELILRSETSGGKRREPGDRGESTRRERTATGPQPVQAGD